MKEVLIVGSYCNTQVKLKALEELLDWAKSAGLPTIIFGRWPIPEHLQRKCDYWIYDRSNPVLEDRALDHFLLINGERISNYFFDFGYAALDQIIKTLGFAKSLHYDVAHWLNYDVDMKGFQGFREAAMSAILSEGRDAACVRFKPLSAEPLRGINTTVITFKVGSAYDKLCGVLTKSFYRKFVSTDENLVAEDFIEECFRISEVDHVILPVETAPGATLTSTGVRKHGCIPEELSLTRKYLNHLFVGFDPAMQTAVCYIWNMQQPIGQIKADFGNGEIVELNVGFNSIARISLRQLPTKCTILEINDEEINEVLDDEYPPRYWEMNKIQKTH